MYKNDFLIKKGFSQKEIDLINFFNKYHAINLEGFIYPGMSIYEIAKVAIFLDRLQSNPVVINYFGNCINKLTINEIEWLSFFNDCDIHIDCNYLREIFEKKILNSIEYYSYRELDLIVCAIASRYKNLEVLCNRDICLEGREAIYYYNLNPDEFDESIFTM